MLPGLEMEKIYGISETNPVARGGQLRTFFSLEESDGVLSNSFKSEVEEKPLIINYEIDYIISAFFENGCEK